MSKSLAQVKNYLNNDEVQNRLKNMLDKNASSFTNSVINIVTDSKALQACDPASVVKSAMVAATLNLPIDPNLGFAAVVPYGKTAQFQIMYKGLIQLAIRSGQFEKINAVEVYEDELESYNPFEDEIKFTDISEWKMRNSKDGKVVGYYAYLKLKTGFSKGLYMTKEQVENHALEYSQTYKKDVKNGIKQTDWNASRWTKDFDKMAIKTVLKQLIGKYGILSTEIQSAVTFDQARIKGTLDNPQPEYIDNNPEKPEGSDVPDPANDFVEAEYTSVDEITEEVDEAIQGSIFESKE